MSFEIHTKTEIRPRTEIRLRIEIRQTVWCGERKNEEESVGRRRK
jgi:hypothetical protein